MRWEAGMAVDEDRSFAEFVATRSAALLRTAYLLTGDRHRAEDLLQTALANCYASWGRIVRNEAHEAYVRTALVRTSISWLRRRRPLETSLAAAPELAGPDPHVALVERDATWRLLQSLPQRQRAVLVLRYYEDQSDAEIADALHCSTGTVKSQASRALAKLRLQLTASPGVPGNASRPLRDAR